MEASLPPAIVTSALTRRFDERIAVDALDLRIDRGVFFGLIGSNGAGKTTLIKMLTTLLPPTSGSAKVAGRQSPGSLYSLLGSGAVRPKLVHALGISRVPEEVASEGRCSSRGRVADEDGSMMAVA